MTLRDGSPPVNRATGAFTSFDDERQLAFADWIAGLDALDHRKSGAAAKTLRQLGISICLVASKPSQANGGRL